MEDQNIVVPSTNTAAISPEMAATLTIGQIANEFAKQDLLAEYQREHAGNTLRRQKRDIALFEQYILEAEQDFQLNTHSGGMQNDLSQWKDVTWGLIKKFNEWQLNEGYAIASINSRLATLKTYCELAALSEHISDGDLAKVRGVKGISRKSGVNIDEKRKTTRLSNKKARPTALKLGHVDKLKASADIQDRLIICLMFDHAMRCSEVAALDIESLEIDQALHTGLIHIYRRKTQKRQKHTMTTDTYEAAVAYLASIDRKEGPLFIGKISGQRISSKTIYNHVKNLGRTIGLTSDVSPHDGRHYFVDAALSVEENSIVAIKRAGGWESTAMVDRYATEREIANEGLILPSSNKKKEGNNPC